MVQQRTFSTTTKVFQTESNDSCSDLPDLVDSEYGDSSDVDSDTETAVSKDDDFLSVEDDDPTYCNNFEIWANGDPDHEHTFQR